MAERTSDWLLVMFLDLAERDVVSIDVTLLVGGTVVSGTPISIKEYFTGLGEQLGEGFDRAAGAGKGDVWREQLSRQGERAHAEYLARLETRAKGAAEAIESGDSVKIEEARATEQDQGREYVLLRDATVFGPSSEEIRVPLWRGRLVDVAGWFLGRSSVR